MQLTQIIINNFRKLKNNVVVDLSEETLIVGKNNTGKTSVSELFTKFFTLKKSFKLEDFSSSTISKVLIDDIYTKFSEIDEKENKIEKYREIEKKFPIIELDLYIAVTKNDNLALIKPLLYEFTNNENLIIKVKYEFEGIAKFVTEYQEYKNKLEELKDKNLDFFDFFKRKFSEFYKINVYSTKKDSEYENRVEISEVIKLFNIGIINAQREVDDTSDQNSQSISNAIWSYYQSLTKDSKELNQEDVFKDAIESIKLSLNSEYTDIFAPLLKIINDNIIDTNNQSIEISSQFSIEDVLKKNSKIKYNVEEFSMPESYNGLGFSNLMYIFIQIITYIDNVKKENKVFNLLFIEEPESHLHPQMQSVFLQKIRDIIDTKLKVNRIITTHSSYILQSSDLKGIRFFYNNDSTIEVRSLDGFFNDPKYASLEDFLKKYFKINTCDLFFADKAILVEGTVERMLMTVLIQKFDQNSNTSLSKQHLTILEVGGAYAHIFNELLEFLNLKTLIITDIDSVSGNNNSKCKCDLTLEIPGSNTYKVKTSNAVIKNWFNINGKFYLNDLLELLKDADSLIKKVGNIEIKRLAFQRPIKNEKIWGRTFEEQFIIENSELLDIVFLPELKNAISKTKENRLNELSDKNITPEILKCNAYEIVENIDKTNFALNLLNYDQWNVPNYIQEGLEWLTK
ncbi:AAA family ATPase [Lysinibacillus sp. NPDC093216]|uniref:AAA family ATPase n=1 Tax=Lysinibacillus sp. NPDC093216 TaxID=3390576 RepID=UPI003CFC9EA7